MEVAFYDFFSFCVTYRRIDFGPGTHRLGQDFASFRAFDFLYKKKSLSDKGPQ